VRWNKLNYELEEEYYIEHEVDTRQHNEARRTSVAENLSWLMLKIEDSIRNKIAKKSENICEIDKVISRGSSANSKIQSAVHA